MAAQTRAAGSALRNGAKPRSVLWQEVMMSPALERPRALVPRESPGKYTRETVRKALLAAGALSSLLYVVTTDVVLASLWDNYSRTGDMVSKLFAVGAPGRPVVVVFIGVYTVLFTAFGVGVRASAHGSRALRVTAALLIAYGLWNIMAGFFPLDLNNDASVPGHIVATNVQLLLMVTAMGYAAAAFHGWLRWYSIASLFTSVVLGAVAFMFAAQAPHPVLGIGERISIGAFLLWVAVLAGALWRTRVEAPAAGADGSRRPNEATAATGRATCVPCRHMTSTIVMTHVPNRTRATRPDSDAAKSMYNEAAMTNTART
jgi:hypothetical protein